MNLIDRVKLTYKRKLDPDYRNFKTDYFSKFVMCLGFIMALGNGLWLIKDLTMIHVVNTPHSIMFRLLPIFLLPFYKLTKKIWIWVWTYVIMFSSLLLTYAWSVICAPNAVSGGEGWFMYYIFVFGLSISSCFQEPIILADILISIVILKSDIKYGGGASYLLPVDRIVITGLLLSFGLLWAASAIKSIFVKLYESELKLKEAAKIDMLSGLYNRHKLDDLTVNGKLEEESTIMIIDIDKFKSINDTFGHCGGDKAIQWASNALAEVCRKNDTLVRYGGDEFLIIFKGHVNEADIFARLQKRLANPDNIYKITFSIGSYYSAENNDLDACIKKADIAAYKSKSTGKNKITLYRNILESLDSEEKFDAEKLLSNVKTF